MVTTKYASLFLLQLQHGPHWRDEVNLAKEHVSRQCR